MIRVNRSKGSFLDVARIAHRHRAHSIDCALTVFDHALCNVCSSRASVVRTTQVALPPTQKVTTGLRRNELKQKDTKCVRSWNRYVSFTYKARRSWLCLVEAIQLPAS